MGLCQVLDYSVDSPSVGFADADFFQANCNDYGALAPRCKKE
jgi:hypothetical protein